MKNFRSILAWLIIVASVGYHVYQWGQTPELSRESGERALSIEERMFLFQMRVILGSKDALGEYLTTASPVMAQTARDSYKQGVSQVVEQIFRDAPLDLESANNRTLLREKIIFALRLNENYRVDSLTKSLSAAHRNEYEEYFDEVFLRVVERQKTAKDPTLTQEESNLFDEELLDFAKFLHVQSVEYSLELDPEVRLEVKTKASNFFVGALSFIGLIGLAGFFFVFYCWLFLSGRTKFLYKKSGMPKYLPIETFALYMLAMLFAPKLLQYLMMHGYITNIIIANVVFISATLLILLWPVFWGQPVFAVRQAYGIYFDSVKGFLKNIIIAPTFYLGSWIVFITALVLYGLLLEHLHIQVEKGAHPIVPLLLSSKDSSTPLLIALLATVIAPLIEEIMFRGALYSGLRGYMNAPISIVLSALLFASIHPQGAIGMLPLTFIGIFLAFLREWRGSLVTPIIAHACVNGGTLIMVTLLMK